MANNEFPEISKNTFLLNTSGRLLLDIAELSMIKASRTLISMYTNKYDDTDIENCKKDVQKTVPVDVTIDWTW